MKRHKRGARERRRHVRLEALLPRPRAVGRAVDRVALAVLGAANRLARRLGPA